ncbi:MAG: hypothetical protein MUF52_12335 [Syntrophobacteraceae bacterium]|jgi:hypothetical protein|nr:hypothetical protein [Syntrophobacteraceae bacterium]
MVPNVPVLPPLPPRAMLPYAYKTSDQRDEPIPRARAASAPRVDPCMVTPGKEKV